ncbi:hypothetical protein HDA39_008365 [Kribbella italica]|uniref:Uncharacterized protein n=1 Tax=Kribbella italica TaxID=1540520 RepID=A0A7W9JGB6_9ACTN|nr:hypothetical protein [Kribbella italica]
MEVVGDRSQKAPEGLQLAGWNVIEDEFADLAHVAGGR